MFRKYSTPEGVFGIHKFTVFSYVILYKSFISEYAKDSNRISFSQ